MKNKERRNKMKAWIARDKRNGCVFMYVNKPTKAVSEWKSDDGVFQMMADEFLFGINP